MTISPSFVWLFLGGMLQVFGIGKWIVPLAAWLAPLFLLHFTRAAPPAAAEQVQKHIFCQYLNKYRAPLKIQFSSQYGVTRKKLSLTYQLYAALKFFTHALSCLET